jgi:hypothetical protein
MWKLYNNYEKTSGNLTTINRLSILLNLPLTNKIENNIIGIHAIKFGLKVFDKNINYGLIIGGTDVYDLEYFSNINFIDILNNSKFIVVFNNYIYKIIYKLTENNNIFIIKQSFIPLTLKNQPNLLLKVHKEKPYNKVFLFIGNLRKIKDPFYLKPVFDYLYENYKYLLVFIGNNDEYQLELFNGGYYYFGSLNYKLTLTQLLFCDGLINSSINEGMSSSIIEAMYYKIPVYARNNEGNSVFNNILLYTDPIDFISKLNIDTRKITNDAKIEYYLEHNIYTERFKYNKILNIFNNNDK